MDARFAGGSLQLDGTDAMADDIAFNASLRVSGFSFRYAMTVPVDATVGFHQVDPTTGGPGATVASFKLEDLPATSEGNIRAVTLPTSLQFDWAPTPGIYKNNGGSGASGGFFSVTMTRADGTPLVRGEGGWISADQSTRDVGKPLFTTAGGYWNIPRNSYASGAIDYVPRSLYIQLAGTRAPIISSLTLSQSSVQGGNRVQGTLELLAPAPAGGYTIQLSSSNTAVARTAATIFVPEGVQRVTFDIDTLRVKKTTSVTISATLSDEVRQSVLSVLR
jgi:hypothetical protein